MTSTEQFETGAGPSDVAGAEEASYDEIPPFAEDTTSIEVRRNAPLSIGIGATASVVAIAYLGRATGSGAWLDWGLFALMGALAIAFLFALVDSRTPLFVADEHGVRLRRGRTWRGMPWTELDAVEVLPRRGLLRDGSIDILAGREEPLRVPLSVSTRVVGGADNVADSLADLAGERAEVVEIAGYEYVSEEEWAADGAPLDDVDPDVEPVSGPSTPETPEETHDEASAEPAEEVDVLEEQDTLRRIGPRSALAHGIGVLAARLQRRPESTADRSEEVSPTEAASSVPSVEEALVASATPSPLREPVTAVRAEILPDPDPDPDPEQTRPIAARELRREGRVNLVEETVDWSAPATQITPLTIDDLAVGTAAEPAEDPVIGPQLAAARTRIGLSVDLLAERTRIRPHVIESIEVDDFAPCGGDFYARGHLRTLARVVGIDAAPLLEIYAERYAHAPIDARRVFEAELATGEGGSIRGTRGGPNWSVLVASVMALVLCWSVARLIMDSSPAEDRTPAISLQGGSGGTNPGAGNRAARVPVELTAVGGGAQVVVRNGDNKVVYTGPIAFGDTLVLKVAPPIRVQSSDGSLTVSVDGKEAAAIGETGRAAQQTYVVR